MLDKFWLWLEYLPLAQAIGPTWWFPLIESLHVVSITLMLGAILMLDLRLLGVAALRYSIDVMNRELLPWSAAAFFLAMLTGLGMFITRASAHIENPAFLLKMAFIVLAAINIVYCHYRVLPRLRAGESDQVVDGAARLCAILSLSFWCAVMLAGRWIGHIV